MEQDQNIYEFGQFELNPAEYLILRGGVAVPLTGKPFETLVTLIQRRGRLVEKRELLEVIWRGSFVEEGNLAVTISTLRRALGDDRREHKYIETVAKRGYRFVADVQLKKTFGEIDDHSTEMRAQSRAPIEQQHPPRSGSPAWSTYVSVAAGLGIIITIGLGFLHPLALISAAKSIHPVSAAISHNGEISRSRNDAQDPQAQQLYLEGRYYWNKRTKEGLRRGLELFQQATFRDPRYAKAYAGLADSYVLLASYGIEPAQEAYPNAKEAVLKALQLDWSLAEAHASLGMISFQYEWNWPSAEAEFRRAIQLDPNYATAHIWYAMSLAAVGKHDQSLHEAKIAERLDPLSPVVNTELGRVYYWSGEYDQAVAALSHAIDLDPDFARAHTRLGMAYAAERNFSGAINEFKSAVRLSGADPYLDALLGYAEAHNGNSTAAQDLLAELTERSMHEYIPAYSIALVYVGLGNREQAFNWLDKAFGDRSEFLIYAKVDPLLNLVRSDPRFDVLLANMDLLPTKAQKLPTAARSAMSKLPDMSTN